MKAIAFLGIGLLLVSATSRPSHADIETGFSTLSTAFGVYDGAGDGGDAAFGLSVTAEVAKINENATIEAGLGWFQDGSEYTQTMPGSPPITATAEADFRNISVLGGPRYHFRTSSPKFDPYVNGGIELAFWKASSSIRSDFMPEPIEASASDTDFGIYVGGGTEYEIGDNLSLLGGLGFHTATSGYVALHLGVTYMLGN